jgi:two-component sensor histidine kinase
VTKHLKDIFVTRENPIRFLTEYVDYQINAEDAMRLGLIVNELVTNSVKHAFTEVQVPEINITTNILPDGKLALKYEDNGPGLSHQVTTEAQGASLGIKLIDLLRKQLGDRYVVMC